MARVKQTARKGPAKKKSPAKPRRSERLAAQNELEDYEDEPAPEAEDTTYVQTGAKTRSDTTLERQDDRANVAAEAELSTPGFGWSRLVTGPVRMGGAVSVLCGKKRGSRTRKFDAALPCDPFSASGYPPGWNSLVDDHPAYVEKKYRDAGFDWDHAESRAKIDALAAVCQKLDLCMPVPNNMYMLAQWVEWLLELGEKATPARRVRFRDSAQVVAGLAADAAVAMSAIARAEGPPDCCDSCAVGAIGLLENHEDVEEITLGGLVVTRDGRGGYVIDNTNLNQTLYADHLALCCTGPRCWLCNHCNTAIHAQADEFDDAGFVSLYEREHANINNNHVF